MVDTIKLGDLVRVVFWDHCMDSDENGGIIESVVYGKAVEISEDEVKICPWETNFEDGVKNEYYCLVRSAIESINILEVKGG